MADLTSWLIVYNWIMEELNLAPPSANPSCGGKVKNLNSGTGLQTQRLNNHQAMQLSFLLYTELTISFLIGWKRTVNFRNQHLWHHLAADRKCMISKGNHVKFARFVFLVVSEEAKTWLPFFFLFSV